MDILGWLRWVASTLVTGVLSLMWFLISGWVSTCCLRGRADRERGPGEGVWRRQHFNAVTAVDSGRPDFVARI
jgi:hypothetical protein